MNQKRDKKYSLQIVNIKLQTDKLNKEKTEAYINLIKELKLKKIHVEVNENYHMIIYSCIQRISNYDKIEFYYGALGKGIYFEEDEIPSINIEQSTNEYRTTDKGHILKPKTITYIFIPSIHKFCIFCNEGISITETFKFLKQSLPKVASKEDLVEIEIVKDPIITEDILKSFQIHSLDYTISYSNDDPNSSMEKQLDDRLKKLNIGKIGVKIEADHNNSLNLIDKDELIEGGIKLAEKNGTVNSAVVTKIDGGERETLTNKESHCVINIKANDDNFLYIATSKIFNYFTK